MLARHAGYDVEKRYRRTGGAVIGYEGIASLGGIVKRAASAITGVTRIDNLIRILPAAQTIEVKRVPVALPPY